MTPCAPSSSNPFPDQVSALLAQAEDATRRGRDHVAIQALRHALTIDFGRVQPHCLAHESIALRQNFMLASVGTVPGKQPRPFYLFQECALLGRFRPALTSTQRRTIYGLLDLHEEQWRSGLRKPPVDSDIYRLSAEAPAAPATTVAVVGPKYIHCDPNFLDNDLTHYYGDSAAKAGLKVEYFYADELVGGASRDLPAQLTRLARFLAETRPGIVVTLGDFFPKGKTIDADKWALLKRKYGFKILCVLPDCYDHLPLENDNHPDLLAYWGRIADLCVIYHRYSMRYDDFLDRDKIMFCPSCAISETGFRGCHGGERDLGLSYVGSDSRFRDLFLDVARHSGIPTHARIHTRERITAPDMDEYISILGRSKLFFNNGWRADGDGILTGRMVEAILSGSLLIQEMGTCIDDFLVPFIHYIPVANLHQFLIFTQFFLEEDERRELICKEALRFWIDHYSSRQFWKVAVSRLWGPTRMALT